jgi:hypothetical protein
MFLRGVALDEVKHFLDEDLASLDIKLKSF